MTIFYNGNPAVFTLTRNRLWLLLLINLLLVQGVLAQSGAHMIPISLEERLQGAEMVVEGEVIAKQSFWDQEHKNIYTSNIIKVYKVFKGTLQEKQIEVITEGGTVGLDKHVYSVALTLSEGQQGMFFLKRQNLLARTPGKTRLSTRAYASEQGFIKYDTRTLSAKSVFDSYTSIQQVYSGIKKRTGANYKTISANQKLQATSQKQMQQSALAPVVTSFSPKVASGGTETILTINGTGFGSVRGKGNVSFKNADDGGRTFTEAPEDAYLSWTNTQIRMYVPSTGSDDGTAGTGEIRITANDGTTATTVDKITIPFTYTNLYEDSLSYQPALIDVDDDGGYTIHFAPSMQSRLEAQEGFIRAMNSWICTTNVNWKIGAPTTKEESEGDDEVIIMFAPESEVGKNVLARTLSRYRGCQVTATKEINWWLSEFDMEINSNITWQYGPGPPGTGQFDFETVMLHELGHAHQLGHVILPNEAVMHYALEYKRDFRDLSEADITGGRTVIAESNQQDVASVCRQPLMEPKLDGECNLAPEIATLQAAYNSNGDVEVTWETDSEANISRYIVERSQDGNEFEEVGTVDAAADNRFVDEDPLPRTSYYRLRVIYNDGNFKYTFKVRVTDPKLLNIFEVYPNPVGADEKFTISFLVNRNTPVELFLYDMTGKVVRSFTVVFTDANLPLEFDMTGIAPGAYVLKWSSQRVNGNMKIVKL
ncbi:T9SS type A sorting domain-containing protein [Pontibacter sp. KCTC 32443]|uniref:T9SS type A sorting domain-containing protein n=1 Tax=Pontibacter TaxID=323449 RepID=UPI00164D662D|nr:MULTISPECIES: T9SS type A sorting domain-containing protein [Pontibacter]MBC5775780.1 T9SS type A sorting domain-containing protein [Pontibacter sp. KCTC 32443]